MKTGKVKQVAAFEKLVGICHDLGASYNPSKESIKPTALGFLLEQAQQSVEAVNSARTNLLSAVNARKEIYAGIPELAARIVRAVAASEGSAETIKDARSIKRRLVPNSSGRKAKPLPPAQSSAAAGADVSEPSKTVNTSSRLDYDGMAETFGNLIKLVQMIPSYQPNETDLKVDSLKAFLEELRLKSREVTKAATAYSNSLIARNLLLKGKGGIRESANATKDYIRSVVGTKSEKLRQIGRISFSS